MILCTSRDNAYRPDNYFAGATSSFVHPQVVRRWLAKLHIVLTIGKDLSALSAQESEQIPTVAIHDIYSTIFAHLASDRGPRSLLVQILRTFARASWRHSAFRCRRFRSKNSRQQSWTMRRIFARSGTVLSLSLKTSCAPRFSTSLETPR